MIVFVFVGCYLSSNDNSSSAPQEDVSFETDVTAILTEKCATSGCHAGGTPAGALNLNIDDSDATTLYTNISAQIDVDTPEESALLTKASNTVTHAGGEVITVDSDEYQAILAWISEGAFNDNCDAIPHSFATDVTPIFSQCTTAGCHDVTAPILVADPFQNITDAESVDIDSPAQSPLLRKPLGLDTHSGGAVFPSKNDDYKTIFCWIKEDDAIDN